MKVKQSPTVLALTTAAMALPGISLASPQPSRISVAVQTSAYSEANQSTADIVIGDRHRYDIDIHQLSITTPVAENFSISLDTARELMSGASPWGTTSDINGEPKLIMTGATISDQRTEIAVNLTRYQSWGNLSATVESSHEQDYDALGLKLAASYEFNRQQSIVDYGISYSSDTLEPTDADLYGRIKKADKDNLSIFASITQIINQQSQLKLGLGYSSYHGFLSDPYKLRDIRPPERDQISVSGQYRKYLAGPAAALHVDYRYYTDDYDIDAHTLRIAWHQNIGNNLTVTPSVRYYSQSEAGFYRLIDDFSLPDSVAQSSDYRLSAYGAITYGVTVSYQLPIVESGRLSLAIEHYQADSDFSHDKPNIAHPGLIEFTLALVGISAKI